MSSKTVTKHKKEWLIHSFLFFAVVLRILTNPVTQSVTGLGSHSPQARSRLFL